MTDRIASYLGSLPEESSVSSFARAIPRTWWINVILFLLTLLSTTMFGAALTASFARGQALDDQGLLQGYSWLLHFDSHLWSGLSYSIPLLLILLAHEIGHYVQCLKWKVHATLPFFGPSPTLLGTVGAFIWIRSPIYNRRSLFDIGVSGPICGFVLLIPFLMAGIWQSRVCPGISEHAFLSFGTPLLFLIVEHFRFPGVATGDICLHPMAIAAWAGLLATAINLLPVGQLDGGHIIYGMLGRRSHTIVSRTVIALLGLAAFLYWPWAVWAIALFFFRQHPAIYDEEPLDNRRRLIGLAAALLLLLSFAPVPIRVA